MLRLKLAFIFGMLSAYGIGCNLFGMLQEKTANSIGMTDASEYYNYLNYLNLYWQYSILGFVLLFFISLLIVSPNIKEKLCKQIKL